MQRSNYKSLFLLIFLCLAIPALAACGSGGASSATSTVATTVPGVAATVKAHATAGIGKGISGAVIRTRTVNVNGKSVTILTDVRGRTLYYRTSDNATTVCSGSCATIWQPVILVAGTPHAIPALPGKLSVVKNANGSQVTYNGHPLYIYTADSAAGDTTGEKVAGVWFVVPTNLS